MAKSLSESADEGSRALSFSLGPAQTLGAVMHFGRIVRAGLSSAGTRLLGRPGSDCERALDWRRSPSLLTMRRYVMLGATG